MILNSCMVSGPLESLRVVPKIVVATCNHTVFIYFLVLFDLKLKLK